jgi:hypothetical protein
MDIDLRPVKKLRESAAARSALGPIIEAVCPTRRPVPAAGGL